MSVTIPPAADTGARDTALLRAQVATVERQRDSLAEERDTSPIPAAIEQAARKAGLGKKQPRRLVDNLARLVPLSWHFTGATRTHRHHVDVRSAL